MKNIPVKMKFGMSLPGGYISSTAHFDFLLIILFLVFLLFLFSEGLLFVSFFWTTFHSFSFPTLEIWPGEGFYVPDLCELTFANTLLLSIFLVFEGDKS